MTDDVKECLRVVLNAIGKCDLPADEVAAWWRRCSRPIAWGSFVMTS